MPISCSSSCCVSVISEPIKNNEQHLSYIATYDALTAQIYRGNTTQSNISNLKLCLSPVAPHVLFTFHCTVVTVAGRSTKENCQDLDAAASSFIKQTQKLYKRLLSTRTEQPTYQ